MIYFFVIILCVIGHTVAQSSSANSTLCSGAAPGSFIPDVSACNRYFSCASDGAEPVPGTCPAPWMFNGDTQSCDWAENVNCFSCPPSPQYINLPVNNSCTQFIRCFNNQSEQMVCPDDLYFDPTLQECNLPSAVNCSRPVVICPPGQSSTPVFVRDPQNCANYFLCVNGQQINQTCPSPLVFNLETRTCDFVNNTDCGNSTNPSPQPEGNSTNTASWQLPTLTGFTCFDDGLFSDPTSCNRYIACIYRVPYVYRCSAGMYFNDRSKTCALMKPGFVC